MPGRNDPDKKSGEKRQFINEKIVRQTLTRRQIAKRLLAFLFIAIIFGVVAAISFALSRPFAVRYLGGETKATEATISIPKDEPSELGGEVTTEATTEPTTEAIEKVVQSAVEKYRYSAEDINSFYATMRGLAQDADKGIVLVHSVQQEVDWFDNPVETTGQYAGAVIASTRWELLILTPEAAVGRADAIRVTFSDGSEASGRMKQKDQIYGMAVVSVNIDDVEESTWNTVATLKLGNSYILKQGDMVIAIGSPAGFVHSTDYGFITGLVKNAQVVDGSCRALYSNVHYNVEMGTFLVNTSGELVGWVTDTFQNERNVSEMAGVMGISDYKGTLERLSNGLGVPYFGIRGLEVGETMAEQGLPQGVYVQTAVIDGPAYNAGIQSGDTIIKINEKEITSMKDFQSVLENLECGQLVHVVIQRNGREGYTQLEFQVTMGTR